MKVIRSPFLRMALCVGLIAAVSTAAVVKVRKPLTAVVLDKMNVLYTGLENPISVSVSGYLSDQITVKADDAVLKGANGQYFINPNAGGRSLRLSVYVKGNKLPVHESVYRVRTLPTPQVFLGNNVGHIISKANLQSVYQLRVSLGESFALEDIKYKVQSFMFIHASKIGGSPFFTVEQGDLVSSVMRRRFDQAQPGDMFVIRDIIVEGPLGKDTINAPVFTVK